jgi:hypothetical protein
VAHPGDPARTRAQKPASSLGPGAFARATRCDPSTVGRDAAIDFAHGAPMAQPSAARAPRLASIYIAIRARYPSHPMTSLPTRPLLLLVLAATRPSPWWLS